MWLRNSRTLPRRGRPRGPGGSFRHGLCRYRVAKKITKPTVAPNARTGHWREIAMTFKGERFLKTIDIPQSRDARPEFIRNISSYTVVQRIVLHGDLVPKLAWIGVYLPDYE